MRKHTTGTIGIEQGEVVLFSDFEDDGKMWTGDGPRVSTTHVAFSETYFSIPNVMVSASMMDVSNDAYLRFDLQAENIKESGFDIVFRTWGDSQVARVRVAWQSIGAVADDDAWDL